MSQTSDWLTISAHLLLSRTQSHGQPSVKAENVVWLFVQEEQEKELVSICTKRQEGRKYVPCKEQRTKREG